MKTDYSFHPAVKTDAKEIAKLIAISSDGVAVVEWTEQAEQQGCEPLDIGEATYQQSEGDYSYRNAIMVEKDGLIAGMLLSFAMPSAPVRDDNNRPDKYADNVFAPYMYLEEPGSWYICGIAFYPRYRGQGLGTKLLKIAEQQASDNGYHKLSLVAFKENTGSVRLYERLGYKTVDWAPIVPHPLIHYTGDALLMVKEIL
ncbi:MAG: GNAT family N-acetyltransferase [Gammaproteobacteria bacterium]